MVIAGSQPSSSFALEGHAWQIGPIANLRALGFLSFGYPAGPRAPWALVAGLTARPLAAGSPGPRGVGRSLWPGFLVCGQPGWPPPRGLDVFLGNFGALGLRAGSALTSSMKALSGPWGPGTTPCGPKGVQRSREAKDASPSREWAADRGPSNFGGPRAARGAQVPGRFSLRAFGAYL